MQNANEGIVPIENNAVLYQSNLPFLASDLQALKPLDDFNKALNQKPPKEVVKINRHADNSEYLPISFIEMGLDKLFMGLWETKDYRFQVVGNEVIGSIVLRVFHPIAKMWIERIGAAAVPIRFKAAADIRDVGNKIKNALVQDFPHLKSECMKNAAKSFGKSFGRDLNREFTDIYTAVITVFGSDNKGEAELKQRLDTYSDRKALVADAEKLVNEFVEKGVDISVSQAMIKGRAADLRK